VPNPFVPNQLFPDQGNPFAAAAPTPADAYTSNANAYQGWLAQQRASGVASGMLDPQTGWPTQNALIDAAKQYSGSLMASTAAPGLPGKGMISPSKLIFRESQQNRLPQVREAFPQGDGYYPIVTTTKGGEHTVLDGHNRAVVAAERGDDVPFVSLPSHAYDALTKQGFDDQEIAYAALSHAGEDEAASAVNQQFPGARVAERGMKALDKLGDISGYE
jgi:hypothetical protein